MDAEEIVQSLAKQFKVHKIDFLEGSLVNRDEVLSSVAPLRGIELDHLQGDAQRLAFWVNIYNLMTNYFIIKRQIRKSIKSDVFVFFFPKLNVGGYEFTLDDIEHGILRSNQRAPYKPWRQFGRSDARINLIVRQFDYRIHFALNCGAVSCPPLAFYDSKKIEEQLQAAENVFAGQEFLVDDVKKEIHCSLLFKMYRKDFGEHFLADRSYKDYKVRYRSYDWSVAL